MSHPSPDPALSPPNWPYCAHGAVPEESVGCRGSLVSDYALCLAHLNDVSRAEYLGGLRPGADLDLRGTTFGQPLLRALLDALRDPSTGEPCFGQAWFDDAQFLGDAWFGESQFLGFASFRGARFSGDVSFDGAEFSGMTWFAQAQFSGSAGFEEAQFFGITDFGGAQFSREAQFTGAEFSRDIGFDGAQFAGIAWFEEAQFAGVARFGGAQFVGDARFDGAQFSRAAGFGGVRFSSVAWFEQVRFGGAVGFGGARFIGDAGFSGAEFSGDARFGGAQFASIAGFKQAQFGGATGFGGVRFEGVAWFERTLFSGVARFKEAQFAGVAVFEHARFLGDARFEQARFSVAALFGPVLCAGVVDLSGAVFDVPVTLEIAARAVRCERTRWESTATLRLRYATADFGHAVLSFPAAVTAHRSPFTTALGTPGDEGPLAGSDSGVRVMSVRGVDAAHLVLTDVDLSNCLFSGAFHLDQLRLGGRCTFASTPTGFHRRFLWVHRWTRRRTLAEEHHWRARNAHGPAREPSSHGWRTGPDHLNPDLTPSPEDIAATYRQLRKAFEDGKNEPGAADFYYGEMEMRRHDRTSTPPGERGLLWGYWLLSGYGLRATRALGWLAATMLATLVLLMGFGLPQDSPKQEASGVVPPGGGRVTFEIGKADPRNPTEDRFTGERFEAALSVTLNSVVFRSSGQDLTTAGTYIEMASRVVEPVLLGLAVLAVRNRVKR
ncbi:pentapeptide repeat-containing protein [Streptomyces cyaneofuscatus]|uniref:pentapeptide repeat-containing protein n=1 Tax=Streptomyces cyaneofuscatus TaxID=66883 RepID=UPI0036744296